MDRSNFDPFWTHFEKVIHKDKLVPKCKFCGRYFPKNTSIWRMKWHLSGEKGHNVSICTGQVPKDVQEAASKAMNHGNKIQKTIASSRNVNDNAIFSCPREENNEVDNLTRDAGRIRAPDLVDNLLGALNRKQMEVQEREQGVREGRTSSQAEAENHRENLDGEMMRSDTSITPEGLVVDAHETRGEASQATDLVEKHQRVLVELSPHTQELMDGLLAGENETNEKDRDPEWFMLDALECGQWSEQVGQLLEQSTSMVYGVDNWAGDGGRIQMEVHCMEEGAGDAHETRGDASQAPNLVDQAIGRNCNVLTGGNVENMSGRLVQPGAGGSSSGGLHSTQVGLELVGGQFQDLKNTVWSWLMNDKVSVIGIYGMSGMGKTTLAQHMYHRLLKKPDTFCDVYWITVSRDFSIKRLQNSIASCIALDLSNEEEELHRTVKLSKELMKRQKWVMILDNLWNSFELHKVGVPVQVKGCKVILTTRSEKVCKMMDSQKEIKVKPFSKEEAWALFMEKLGHDIALSSEVKKIAQSICKECAGLPLLIKTMAGVMKGVGDIHEWRNALEDLKQSRVRQDDTEEEVFRILRFSYMHLKDSTLQQCFLYCASFPENFEIPREDLIAYLIDEGVIKGLKSREAEFDKGHSMLNRLENVGLLESVTKRYGDCRCVKMHDLIREMAIQIRHENFGVMVKAGAQLKELPDVEEWTDNFVRVPLIKNQIEEIPSIYSPRPKSHTEEMGDDKIEEISLGKLVVQGQRQKIQKKSAKVLQTSSIPLFRRTIRMRKTQTLLKQQDANEVPPARVFSEEDANFEVALAATMQGHPFSSFKIKDQGEQPCLKHSSSTVSRDKRKMYIEDVSDSEDEVSLAHRYPNYKSTREVSPVPATFSNPIPLQSIPAASFQSSFEKDVDPQEYGLPLGDAFEVPAVDLLDVEDKTVEEPPVVSFTPMDGGMASIRDAKSSFEKPQADSPATRVKVAGPINMDIEGLASRRREEISTPLQSLPWKRDDAGVSPQEGSSSVASESGSLEVFMRSAVPDWRSSQYVNQLLHLVNLELSHEVAGSFRVVLRSLKCPLMQLQAHLSQQQSSSPALQCSPAEMLQSMGFLSAQRLQLEKELKDLNEEAATLRERLQCIEVDAKDKEAAIEQLRQDSRAMEVQMEASFSSLYEQGLTTCLNPTIDCVKRHFGL